MNAPVTEAFNWKHALGLMLVIGICALPFPMRHREPAEKVGLSREYAYKICEQVCVQESMIVVDTLRNMQVFADVETYDAVKSLPSIGCQNECWNRIQP